MMAEYNEAEIIKYAQGLVDTLPFTSGFLQIPVQYGDDHSSRFALVDFRPRKYVKVLESGQEELFYKWECSSIAK